MSDDKIDPLLATLGLLFKPHPWHGVPIGDDAPETVTAFLKGACETSAINYLVGQFAFGDQSYAESERTIRLFAEHVMPVLKDL